jgi:cytochrome c-type biogenesis protein CcmF
MIPQMIIPELGNFTLVIALFLALLQGVLPIIGAARGNAVLMSAARPLSFGHFVFV